MQPEMIFAISFRRWITTITIYLYSSPNSPTFKTLRYKHHFFCTT